MTTTTLPLNTLGIDPMNVRSIGRGMDDPQLKASIKAKGVKQPLIVRPGGPGHTAYVGGRRLEQLQALAVEGAIAADYPVPVIIEAVSDVEAREVSLIENVMRENMHPVDEYRAFASLSTDPEKPLDADSIAARFGLSRRHVEQRLALGKLHAKVLEAWRAGHIGQETAQAFTLCADLKHQGRLFDQLAKLGRLSAWAVKEELKLGRDNVGRLIDAVGREAYEARGGKVHVDLFGSDHQVSDPALVRAMLQERVDAIAQRLQADGWSWVIAGQPDDWHLYGEIEPKLAPTAEEKAELAKLEAVRDDENLSWDEQQAAEEALEALTDAIALRSYSTKQKATGGCFVVMCQDGEIVIRHGKVKPEAQQSRKAQTGPDADPKKEPKPEAALSQALKERLASQLAYATQDAIIADKHPTTLAAVHAKIIAGMITPERPHSMPQGLAKSIDKVRQAITPKVLNTALRKRFDAEDYFRSAPKPLCLAAVTEAVGADDARKLADKTKAEIAKWCVANVCKTGWLPAELRSAHYDGPAAKAGRKA